MHGRTMMVTKIEYGKLDSAEMMVELTKRGYVVMSEESYNKLSILNDDESQSMFEMIKTHYENIAGRKGINPVWLLRKILQNEISAWGE